MVVGVIFPRGVQIIFGKNEKKEQFQHKTQLV